MRLRRHLFFNDRLELTLKILQAQLPAAGTVRCDLIIRKASS
jgi:hypothetical protein